jgi:hypothetical protein
LARAKNTSRAEARKRTRDQQRAELADDEQIDDQPETDAAPAKRPPLFQMPPIRDDIRALPSVFREKPLLWLPFVLLGIGFVLQLVFWGLPAAIQPWAALYTSLFFAPAQGLFIFFIGGFLAPRGSWLVGLILGALNGALYDIAIIATAPAGTSIQPTDAFVAIVAAAVQIAAVGALAAGFAGWYRRFLRNMQTNGAQRRAEADAKAKAKRRDERQEARKVAKGRPTS